MAQHQTKTAQAIVLRETKMGCVPCRGSGMSEVGPSIRCPYCKGRGHTRLSWAQIAKLCGFKSANSAKHSVWAKMKGRKFSPSLVEKVLTLVEAGGPVAASHVSRHLGVSKQTVTAILSQLTSMDVVERVGAGRYTRYDMKPGWSEET